MKLSDCRVTEVRAAWAGEAETDFPEEAMKKLLTLLLLLSICAIAQEPVKKIRKDGGPTKAPAASAQSEVTKSAQSVDAALLQDVWNAWCTLDPANPAKFYDKTPGNVYFDIAPLEYHSWSEYEMGVHSVLAGIKSGTANVDEVKIHSAGSAKWATAIVHTDFQMKDGSNSKDDWRWTSVWEKRGGDWKIVHEHISAPAK
jgi:ketosteroid isomerase-like protein